MRPWNVGPIEDDLAIEATWPQQCGIEHIRSVGGGDDDDVRRAVETIHLDQNLVERLFALVVATAEPGAALAADRVDLVDKDDAGRSSFSPDRRDRGHGWRRRRRTSQQTRNRRC